MHEGVIRIVIMSKITLNNSLQIYQIFFMKNLNYTQKWCRTLSAGINYKSFPTTNAIQSYLVSKRHGDKLEVARQIQPPGVLFHDLNF